MPTGTPEQIREFREAMEWLTSRPLSQAELHELLVDFANGHTAHDLTVGRLADMGYECREQPGVACVLRDGVEVARGEQLFSCIQQLAAKESIK
jgi:hypothetical protein